MLPANMLADRLAVDVQGAQALRAQAARGDKAALREVAQQFESMVVQIMLKTMRETHFNTEEDALAESSTVRMYREMLDQQWSEKIAHGRGFGFADMLMKQFESATVEAGEEIASSGLPLNAEARALPLHGESHPEGLPLMPPSQPLQKPLLPPVVQQNPLPAGQAPSAIAGGETMFQTLPESTVSGLVVPGFVEGDKKRSFLESLRPHAEAAERATGVPARFILAHAALESGWGTKVLKHEDGSSSHNLFGIKASPNWRGDTVEASTTEYRYGMPLKTVERFRAYGGYTEAFMDYTALIKRRYEKAYSADGNADVYARAIAEGGYATDPAYAGKLRSVISSVERVGT